MASAVFFEEKQVNAPWMGWLTVMVGVGMLVFVLIEIANRWGNPDSNLSGPVAGVVGIVVIVATVAYLAFTHHLHVSIDREGISYVFVPSFYTPKRIPADAVQSFEIRKLTTSELFEGSRQSQNKWKSKAPKKELCVVGGWTVADLQLNDGRRVLLGTKNPDGLLWALKRLQNQA